MQKTHIVIGALGVAACVAGGRALLLSDTPPKTGAQPVAAQVAAQSAAPRAPAPETTPSEPTAGQAQVAESPGPGAPAIRPPIDNSAFYHRPYQVEHICDGYEYRVLDNGETVKLKKCYSVDRNPSVYVNDPTEQLLADIDAGQPWAVEALEVLGMRFMKQGHIHAGIGMLKEHAARTGKVGLLAVAQLAYMHGHSLEESMLDYEIMRILVAKGHPAYQPKRVEHKRAGLIDAGLSSEQLQELDARIDRYISSIRSPDSDNPDTGGAS